MIFQEPQKAIDNMKKRIITGEWDGKEISREETAQESFDRQMGLSKHKIADLFINLNQR